MWLQVLKGQGQRLRAVEEQRSGMNGQWAVSESRLVGWLAAAAIILAGHVGRANGRKKSRSRMGSGREHGGLFDLQDGKQKALYR